MSLLDDWDDYLDPLMQPSKLAMSMKETDAITRVQHSTNVTKLKSFLRFGHLFHWFATKFDHKAAVLNCNMQNDEPWHFGRTNNAGIEALEELQQHLLSWMILTLQRLDKSYMLDTDAFDKQVMVHLSLRATWWSNQTRRILVPYTSQGRGSVWNEITGSV